MEKYTKKARQNAVTPEDCLKRVHHLLDKIDQMILRSIEDKDINNNYCTDVKYHSKFKELQLLESGESRLWCDYLYETMFKKDRIKPKSESVLGPNIKVAEKLSEKDKYFLNRIARCYRSEIEVLQKHLKTRKSCNSNYVIVAKMFMNNNQTITEDAFECVCTDLLSWMDAYQREDMDTPKFHSITHNSSYIAIVCDNDYAYNCLKQYITQTKTMALRLSALPHTSPTIYCFDAIYEGLVSERKFFLTQLNLKKSKLDTMNWIVIRHEVKPQERKTYFTFLVDERSAHALNDCYDGSFNICMQKITFRCRGIVAE